MCYSQCEIILPYSQPSRWHTLNCKVHPINMGHVIAHALVCPSALLLCNRGSRLKCAPSVSIWKDHSLVIYLSLKVLSQDRFPNQSQVRNCSQEPHYFKMLTSSSQCVFLQKVKMVQTFHSLPVWDLWKAYQITTVFCKTKIHYKVKQVNKQQTKLISTKSSHISKR